MLDFLKVEPRAKIIWDSGFGYEIGYFIRVSDEIVCNTAIVELITGSQKGNTLRSKDSIYWYSEESLQKMYKKYKYWHNFSPESKIVNCNQIN